jgi:hypothetical protein
LLWQFCLDGQFQLCRDPLFFSPGIWEDIHTLAVASVFSQPDHELLKRSYQTAYVCRYQGDEALIAIDVKEICSLVSMVLDYKISEDGLTVVTPAERTFSRRKDWHGYHGPV